MFRLFISSYLEYYLLCCWYLFCFGFVSSMYLFPGFCSPYFCFSVHIFLFFLLQGAVCRILIPWPGMEPVLPAVEALSLNHWTAKEVLSLLLLTEFFCVFSLVTFGWLIIYNSLFCYFRHCFMVYNIHRSMGSQRQTERLTLSLSYIFNISQSSCKWYCCHLM